MTLLKTALSALAALAVASCHQPDDDRNIAIGNSANAAGDGQTLAPRDKSAPPASDGSIPTNDIGASEAPATATSIPAQFRGRWGMVAADCTSARGDAKGLLVIDAASLRFYESRAVPRNLRIASPTEWRADLDYSGEGQTWSELTTVTLLDGGRTLRRMADGPWTYHRCGA